MDVRTSVAAYCRVSTTEQKKHGYGIEIQVRDVARFAKREGFVIRRFYKDEAESGVTEGRKHLRRLIRDCKRGVIGSVVIPSLDRLSRDVRLAENLFYEFEQLGITVLIADMPTYDSHNRKDVLVRQIREAIAEENRKDIIEKLWKGSQARVRNGHPPGGNVPYGYRRRAKGLIPQPGEVEVVRSVFDLVGRGETPSSIARILSAQGLERRNGKPWTQRQVAAIVARAPFYRRGLIRYGTVTGRNEKLALLSNAASR